MLTRREFLKLIFSMLCVPRLPDVETTDMRMLYGQEWAFPLTFPAWFPVEPRIDPDPLKQKVYAPIVREKDG